MTHDRDDGLIDRYLDGEADPAEAEALRGRLAEQGDHAAELAERGRALAELRALSSMPLSEPSERVRALTAQLDRRLRMASVFTRVRSLALAACFVLAGWFGNGLDWQDGRLTAHWSLSYVVDEAAEAHSFAVTAGDIIRAAEGMDPTRERGSIDRALAMAGMTLDVAQDSVFRLDKALLIPWDDGTALQLLYQSGDHQLVTLFVAMVGNRAYSQPKLSVVDGFQFVYWQDGNRVFVAGADMPTQPLTGFSIRMRSGFHT
jgi:anti-sigma factor RsiW